MDLKQLGQFGENIACDYLKNNGYRILDRNYRISFGEIDIIARKRCGLFKFLQGKSDETIHFIEIKALSQVSGVFSPEQRANWKKQNKIKRLAEIWLSKNKITENTPYQIDVIAVSFGGTSEPKIDFFENVVGDR